MSVKRKILIGVITALFTVGLVICGVMLYLYNSVDDNYSDYKVLGYLPSRAFEKSEDLVRYDFDKLTHVNFSFSKLDKDSHMPTLDVEAADRLIILMDYLQSNNYETKVLISIGGAGASYFCEAAASEENGFC